MKVIVLPDWLGNKVDDKFVIESIVEKIEREVPRIIEVKK